MHHKTSDSTIVQLIMAEKKKKENKITEKKLNLLKKHGFVHLAGIGNLSSKSSLTLFSNSNELIHFNTKCWT